MLDAELAANVAPGINLLTDEHKGYNGAGERFSNHAVNYSIAQYVKHYFIHTTGLENAWSLFKRKSAAST